MRSDLSRQRFDMMGHITILTAVLSCLTMAYCERNYSKASFTGIEYILKKEFDEDIGSYPIGVVELPSSGRILVSDVLKKHIVILTSDFKPDGNISHECFEETGPRDMAVSKNGDIYVVCNSRVIALDQEFKTVHQIGSDGNFSNPEGVAVDGTGTIYVVDSGNYRVQIWDINGKFVDKFGREGQGNGEFQSNPTYISVSKDGRVAVTDFDGNLYLFTIQGHYLEETNKFKGLTTARGVIFDDDENLLVCDIRGRIVIYDKKGHIIGQIDDLREPRVVAMMSSGDVLVTEIDKRKVKKIIIPKSKDEL